jgi:hypothetical protein
LSQPS